MKINKKNNLEQKTRDQIIKDAIDYLKNHNILTMATASLDGEPNAAALEYASDDLNVYVVSRAKSWKVNNIKENPRVFYEIHDDVEIKVENMRKIIGLQVIATPEIITIEDMRFNPAFELMEKKFPVFKNMLNKEKRVILLFKPKKLWLLDYSKKFLHRDEVSFE